MLTHSLAVVFLPFCLFTNGTALAEADTGSVPFQKPLDIRVQANAFGTASPAEITAVLNAAASEMWRHCPRTQIGGIDVYYRPDHPQVDFRRTSSGRIAIGLSAHDTHWAQYSFQFAHEFCHALVNFSNNPKQLARYPRHANLWLEESFCETASLFLLRAMSRSWQVAPLHPAWRAYAPWLNDYAAKRLALPKHQLPPGTSFLVWFHRNEAALRQNPDLRDWNTIIAIQFLPIFEADPSGWEAITYLDRGLHNPNESLAQRFLTWRLECPENLRRFVSRLADVFGLKLQPS
jgi:hypothetical protein